MKEKTVSRTPVKNVRRPGEEFRARRNPSAVGAVPRRSKGRAAAVRLGLEARASGKTTRPSRLIKA